MRISGEFNINSDDKLNTRNKVHEKEQTKMKFQNTKLKSLRNIVNDCYYKTEIEFLIGSPIVSSYKSRLSSWTKPIIL